jgi:ABC-type multidrug transport system fused ATPase/permease subunit
MSTAFLDLLGVLLLGVVTALSVASVTGSQIPSAASLAIESIGILEMRETQLVLWLALAAGMLLILKSALNVFLTRRVLRFLANRQALVSTQLASELLARPLVDVQERSSQETAYALSNGVTAATLTVLGQAVVALTEVTLLTVLAVGLLIISPVVTIFSVLFFFSVAMILQRYLSGWAGRMGKRYSDLEIASYASIQEAMRAYRETKVSGRRSLYTQRFSELRWETSLLQSDLQLMGLIPKYVFEIALVVGAGLLALSQFMTKDTAAAVAVIAVFLAAGSRVVPSMLRLQSAALTIKSAAGQAAPTFLLASTLRASRTPGIEVVEVELRDAEKLREAIALGYPEFKPSVIVAEVTFSYPGSPTAALKGVTFSLKAGHSLALVGPTGAGKSTIADLILGVCVPDTGEVLINGVSPGQAVRAWPGGLAYVPQEVAISNGSIRSNVALGFPRDSVDDEWVWEALRRARLDDYLRDMRHGLDTVVGEDGMRLSGGQRQRLGVARALYSSPRLLVLDEATSALDSETERAISDMLKGLRGEVTTITVAHRLATIRECDSVLYIEAGCVGASGSFDDVRRAVPNFNRQAQLLGL